MLRGMYAGGGTYLVFVILYVLLISQLTNIIVLTLSEFSRELVMTQFTPDMGITCGCQLRLNIWSLLSSHLLNGKRAVSIGHYTIHAASAEVKHPKEVSCSLE